MRITAETVGGAAYAQAISSAQNMRSTNKNQEAGGSFDQISISQKASKESKFQQQLAARMVQDVRTSVTTGDIQSLHSQVMNGTYPLNPDSIAAAMLLEG